MSEGINKDLINERKKCSFDVQELIHVIDGGEVNTETRKSIETILLDVKDLWDDIPEEYLSHKEKYENAIRKGTILLQLLDIYKKDRDFAGYREPKNIYTILYGIFHGTNPFVMHIALFLTTIKAQASVEQQTEWLKSDSKMIGTYAQTELGHGSFLRGIETTATLDTETDEFVLHSPALSSYKWWAGGLGKTANTTLVMAQLYINGTCHGLHLFLAQIRDYATHEPLPGVKVGEIGPKMGYNTADNGFVGFNNYRIPRTNLLMKNVQVLRDGTYIKPKHEKLTYGSMMTIRVALISDMAFQLSRAATIAVRYSAIRRQCQIKTAEPESQILDNVMQQHKLFITIATSHAFRVAGKWLWKTYVEVVDDVNKGNMDKLSEIHVLSCCLKAISCGDTARYVEQCRLACGGHGFLMSSHLPQIYATTTAAITYEGESTVLMLQTARYLVKSWKLAIERGYLPPNVAYFADYSQGVYRQWQNSPEGIIDGLKAVSAGTTKAAYDALQRHMKNGSVPEEAWNLANIKLIRACEAYTRSFISEVFLNETQNLCTTVSRNLAIVLQQLSELYLIYWALEKHGDLSLYFTISNNDIDLLQNRYGELLALIRPNAVGLVDSFDIRDEILCSTLGAYDGRVYERLMEQALKSPLNAEAVNGSFHKYLRPCLFKNKL